MELNDFKNQFLQDQEKTVEEINQFINGQRQVTKYFNNSPEYNFKWTQLNKILNSQGYYYGKNHFSKDNKKITRTRTTESLKDKENKTMTIEEIIELGTVENKDISKTRLSLYKEVAEELNVLFEQYEAIKRQTLLTAIIRRGIEAMKKD